MFLFFRIWKQLTRMNFAVILIASLIVIAIGTFGIYFIEKDNFPSVFDGLWWTMTTVTTVGYGDFYPESIAGRILGMFLFLFGIGLVGVLIGKIVDAASIYNRMQLEGKLMIKKKQHYLYIGWSKKAEGAIKEVLLNERDAEIVIVDDRERHPYEHRQVYFVQGDPSYEETLIKANILEAQKVAIFSDPELETSLLADAKTLLIASAVEGLAKDKGVNLQTIAEVNNEAHIPKFEHISIDNFILSNDSVSMLMAKAILNPGTTDLFRQLLSKRFGSNIHEVRPKSEWRTYQDAHTGLLQKGAVLLAVNHNMDYIADKDKIIEKDDVLYIVANDEVARRF